MDPLYLVEVYWRQLLQLGLLELGLLQLGLLELGLLELRWLELLRQRLDLLQATHLLDPHWINIEAGLDPRELVDLGDRGCLSRTLHSCRVGHRLLAGLCRSAGRALRHGHLGDRRGGRLL